MKTAAIGEFKAHLGTYLKADQKEPVVVTRNGKPVAVVVPVMDEEELEDLERLMMAQSPRLQAILAAAQKRIEAGKGIPHERFWAEVMDTREEVKPGGKKKRA